MAVTLEQFGLDRLPPEERLELLELLWDSMGEGTFSPPEWHIRELEKRRATGPSLTLPARSTESQEPLWPFDRWI